MRVATWALFAAAEAQKFHVVFAVASRGPRTTEHRSESSRRAASRFGDATRVALMAMGFCYPGKGASGDLPPRPECAKLWHPQIMASFESKPLILLIGQYAQKHYLNNKLSLTETVKNFKEYLPDYFVLPHPSPRNQNWVKVNTWFSNEVIPHLRSQVLEKLSI